MKGRKSRAILESRKNDYQKVVSKTGKSGASAFHAPGSNKKPSPHKKHARGEVLPHAGTR